MEDLVGADLSGADLAGADLAVDLTMAPVDLAMDLRGSDCDGKPCIVDMALCSPSCSPNVHCWRHSHGVIPDSGTIVDTYFYTCSPDITKQEACKVQQGAACADALACTECVTLGGNLYWCDQNEVRENVCNNPPLPNPWY